MRSTRALVAALVCGISAQGTSLHAQDYPARPITVLVPYPAGGTSDISTRVLAARMTELLGRQVNVENRAGGGGVIGWTAGAKATPDGYTLIALETGFSMAPGLIEKLPFDPRADFAHLSMVAAVPFAMVVNPQVPARTVAEFIALARAQPGKLNYASAGNGTSTHFGAEWFRSLAGVEMLHVPYKGGGPANQAVVANEAQLAFPALPSALGLIKSGKLRALMVTADRRVAAAPDIPSAAEAGLPAMVGDNWFALSAPVRTPPEIQAKLNATVIAALNDATVKERFAGLGLEPAASTPAQARQRIDAEIARWSALVKSAGIKAD